MVNTSSIFITGVPAGEERDNGIEAVFKEILAENFQKMMKISSHRIKNFYKTEARLIQRKHV